MRFAILTVVTTFVWIGFDAYRAFTAEPPQTVPEEVLAPLVPTIDSAILEIVPQRVYLNNDEIEDTILSDPNLTENSSEADIIEEPQTIEGPVEDNEIEEATDEAEES